jgi:aspartate/methionine/tyrosine aminotransferase
MVVPEDQIRRVERLAQNMFICPPHASQVAALAALDCTAELEANRKVYAENRRLMLEGLPKAGFHPHRPARRRLLHLCRCLGPDRRQPALAGEILDGAGVAVTPGLDFDPRRGARAAVFLCPRSTADIAEGLARLADWAAGRSHQASRR